MPHLVQAILPVINLYADSTTSSEVVSQALYGWQMVVLEEGGLQFKKVQTADGYTGWAESEQLSHVLQSVEKNKRAKLLFNAAPIYATPHVNRSKPLFILPFEVELNVLSESEEEEGRWIQVQLLDGTSGWIQRALVNLNSKVLSMREMLNLATQFLGLPYIWGGVSSFGYDCSGFVQMLWRQRGVQLLRDASQQIKDPQLCPVEWSDLQPGDFLFYGTSLEVIGHVGCYLGDENLIHASVRPIPIVQRSHLDDPSLKSRYSYRTAYRHLAKI